MASPTRKRPRTFRQKAQLTFAYGIGTLGALALPLAMARADFVNALFATGDLVAVFLYIRWERRSR